MIGTACVVSYYCSLMAITIFYFFASFRATLPWAECDVAWGGDLCNGTQINKDLTNKTISEIYFE
jgi:solute carrier family 6 amino acid transporter-like protein 5/7/9/14